MKNLYGLMAIAGLHLSGALHAQGIISHVATVAASGTNWTQQVELPSFDSTLGTLTQVRLGYSGQISQSLFLENTGATADIYNLATTATLSLGQTGGPTLLTLAPVVIQRSGTLGAFDHAIDFSGTSGVTFNENAAVAVQYLIDPNLSAYLGQGPLSFTASAAGLSQLFAGNFVGGVSTVASGALSVEYSYTPVVIPEPSGAAAIAGLAVLGAVFWRRSRSRTAAQPVTDC